MSKAPKTKSHIKTFSEYLSILCRTPKVTLEQAEEYVHKGKQFLSAVMNGKETELPSKSKSDNLAFLHWYLIKESFNQHTPFSKGMFNLEGENDEATKRLYSYLKGETTSDKRSLSRKILKGMVSNRDENKDSSYSRPSTHYNDYFANEGERSFGIDQVGTPLAWKFTTHTFGLIKNPDASLSVFIKPETQSMDVNKTRESFQHGTNLIRKAIKPEKIKGISDTFREDSIPKSIKLYVKNSFREEKLLTMDIEKKIDQTTNIPALKKLIATTGSTINLDEHLLQNYGTTNQIGSEMRFKITSDGELNPMRKQKNITPPVDEFLESMGSESITDSDSSRESIGSLGASYEEEEFGFFDYEDDEFGFTKEELEEEFGFSEEEEALFSSMPAEKSQNTMNKYKGAMQDLINGAKAEETDQKLEDNIIVTPHVK